MREEKFTILKALAILLVVLSHAGACGWINQTIFIFHVPIFFFCAGYFFNTAYLNDERTYIVHRIKGLYLPFVRWSIFFLLIHNLLFYTGILNETYGNSGGGVTHPFTWHTFSQNLWNIVFNMSGYDTFLCGTFWFFRSLLLASIAFLVLFKIITKVNEKYGEKKIGWIILVLAMLMMLWKTTEGLNVTGVAQGGARELTGLGFMAMGFLANRYELVSHLNWKTVIPFAVFLVCAASMFPSAMYWRPTFAQFIYLPIAAFSGFVVCLYLSMKIEKHIKFLSLVLIYIGQRTLYIFAFHLVAFKLVSALKVAWYDLPWLAVGGHPYVLEPANNAFWVIAYVVVGVGLPLLWLEGYRRLSDKYDITNRQIVRYIVLLLCLLAKCLRFILHKTWIIFKNLCRQIWAFIKEMIF